MTKGVVSNNILKQSVKGPNEGHRTSWQTKHLVLGSQRWVKSSFGFTIQRILIIVSSFRRSKQLLCRIIILSIGVFCFLVLAFSNKFVREEACSWCTTIYHVTYRRSSTIFIQNRTPSFKDSTYPLVLALCYFCLSWKFYMSNKSMCFAGIMAFKRCVPTSSKPCRPAT